MEGVRVTVSVTRIAGRSVARCVGMQSVLLGLKIHESADTIPFTRELQLHPNFYRAHSKIVTKQNFVVGYIRNSLDTNLIGKVEPQYITEAKRVVYCARPSHM